MTGKTCLIIQKWYYLWWGTLLFDEIQRSVLAERVFTDDGFLNFGITFWAEWKADLLLLFFLVTNCAGVLFTFLFAKWRFSQMPQVISKIYNAELLKLWHTTLIKVPANFQQNWVSFHWRKQGTTKVTLTISPKKFTNVILKKRLDDKSVPYFSQSIFTRPYLCWPPQRIVKCDIELDWISQPRMHVCREQIEWRHLSYK